MALHLPLVTVITCHILGPEGVDRGTQGGPEDEVVKVTQTTWPFTHHLSQSSHVTSSVQRGWTGVDREGQRMRGGVNNSR